jgi:oleandomycin transport system permease protein
MTTTAPAPTARAAALTPAAAAVQRPFALLRHSGTLAWRGVLKTIRTPESLIDVTLQPIIFLLLFVYVFGGASVQHGRHEYLQFILPGIIGQNVAFAAVAIGVNLNTDLEKGIFDRFRSLPIARSAPLIGAVLADVIRFTVLATVCTGFGLIMGFRVHTNPADAVAACALAIAFALCLSWVSVWVGLMARSSGSVQGIGFLVLFPLSFGSSAFVPVSTMPGWLQAFNHVNPMTHLIDAMRGLMVGGAVAEPIGWTFVSMAALLVIFVPLALRAYRRKA